MRAVNQERYALYLGDGRYVENVEQHANGRGLVHATGNSGRVMTWGRRGAIEALHIARRAGVSAWITAAPVAGVAA